MVRSVTSTPRGSNDRMNSLASWATTPTPPAPSPPASASRTSGSASNGISGSAPGPRYTTGPGGRPSPTASLVTARPTRGDRPASPDQRAERATLPVVARAEANTASSASHADAASRGAATEGDASQSGIASAATAPGPSRPPGPGAPT